jgi:hypothetical protein
VLTEDDYLDFLVAMTDRSITKVREILFSLPKTCSAGTRSVMVMAEPSASFEPYIGPQPFNLADSDRFYAREVEARELFALTVAHQVVVLYAVSG